MEPPRTRRTTTPALAVIAGVLALGVGAPGARGQEGDRPAARTEDGVPPRVRVGGLDSLRVISRVRFQDSAVPPHVLDSSFAFPARARVSLRSEQSGPTERVLRYRRGDEVFGLGSRVARSVQIEGAARNDELLGLEARLALLLWPDAHKWVGEHRDQRFELAGLGALQLELHAAPPGDFPGKTSADVAPRPVRVAALRTDGTTVETLEVLGWRRDVVGGRIWPSGLRLLVDGVSIWEETIERVEPSSRFAEDWFVPPDRRAPGRDALSRVLAVDLLDEYVCDIPLSDDAGRAPDIAGALQQAAAFAADARTRGLALAAQTTLVLSDAGTPRAVRLTLDGAPPEGAEGWWCDTSRPAWVSLCDSVDDVDEARMRELERAASYGSEIEREWLLVITGVERGEVRIVLAPRSRATSR